MTVETDTERTSMLADFGEAVIFSPGSTFPNRNDNTATINAIFDNTFFEVIGEEMPANMTKPTVVCKTADVAAAERNSMIERGAEVYKVASAEPDGTGVTLLILEGPRL